MNKTQIIKLLETRFCDHIKQMDFANDCKNRPTTQYYAGLSCEIAEILATINGISIDTQNQVLFDKYNLNKY